MIDPRQELAVLNNVFWYRAMFRAHRLDDTLDDLTWSSAASPPPFHSNLVVISPALDMLRAREQLKTLESKFANTGFSLKDSFAQLDLAAHGYEVLFEAKWIWQSALDLHATRERGNWTALTSPEQLEAWEKAWWGDVRNTLTGSMTQQFPESLLESPNHRFFAKLEGTSIVAGAIANRSPGAVGLSNTFQCNAPLFNDWAGLINCASNHFPGVSMVGYERGDALDSAVAAGFVPTGALRIWQRASRATCRSPAGDG